MKALNLQLQDGFQECVVEMLNKTPSTELEKEQKEQYGWSDETYLKLLAFHQTLLDIGATVSDNNGKGNCVSSLSVYNSSGDKEHNDLVLLKMCNFIGIRFKDCELKSRGSKFVHNFPNEVIAHFRDPITPAQQEKLLLMVEGFCCK